MLRGDGINNVYSLIAALVESFSAHVSFRVSIGKAAGVILDDIVRAVKTQSGKHDVIDPRLLFEIGQVSGFAHGAIKKKNVSIVAEPGRNYFTTDA